MNFANLNIGKRLGLGFGAICVMLVGMIATSNMMLGRINTGTEEIVANRMPRIESTTRLIGEVNDIAIALRNMMLTEEQADRQKQAEEVRSSRKEIDRILDELEKTLQNPKARELLTQMNQHADRYTAGQEQLIKHVNAGLHEEARQYLAEELRPLLVQLKKAVHEQAELQKALAREKAEEAQRTYENTARLMWALGAVALALAGFVAWSITRSITRPVQRALEVANTVAAGDLTSRIDVTTRDEAGQLLQALKTMNENLARTVGTVRTGTDTITVAAAEVAAGSQDLSARTEQQASSLEETASSMEELTSTVKQNADNARQANVLAEAASQVAQRGGAVIGQVVGTMTDIDASSGKISDIIGVIDGIAFQTNILALNAAVEAARAGEQGRGFAVVASEVRNLAQRSAAAAKEIKGLINDSSEKVASGSRLVAEAGATMQEIVDSVRRVTDIMGEITSASQEQTAGIEQINQAVVEMDNVTQQNAALVEEAAAAAEAMKEQAATLNAAMAAFRVEGGEQAAAPAAARGAQRPVMALAAT
ncbi:methyl-accepting chemotaxis protein [Massilia sp. 9I]|uniref:methyl-accepting chemotaxis protein n=1 Tax=Massilia sp. 9I TaxID=2653152 RepID=UPI0012F00913|nr:methyl-accepting chemotaxis protein [Massilia sp. 9I]VXB31158.1 methyl-accepting chemotaxis protein II [Massilia sp. 9I]